MCSESVALLDMWNMINWLWSVVVLWHLQRDHIHHAFSKACMAFLQFCTHIDYVYKHMHHHNELCILFTYMYNIVHTGLTFPWLIDWMLNWVIDTHLKGGYPFHWPHTGSTKWYTRHNRSLLQGCIGRVSDICDCIHCVNQLQILDMPVYENVAWAKGFSTWSTNAWYLTPQETLHRCGGLFQEYHCFRLTHT